jgi:hypothetical protein
VPTVFGAVCTARASESHCVLIYCLHVAKWHLSWNLMSPSITARSLDINVKFLHRSQTVNDFHLFTDFWICIKMIPKNNCGFIYYKTQGTEQFSFAIKYILFVYIWIKAELNILIWKQFLEIFSLRFGLNLFNVLPWCFRSRRNNVIVNYRDVAEDITVVVTELGPNIFQSHIFLKETRGSVVVEALRYKAGGRWFRTRWGERFFFKIS